MLTGRAALFRKTCELIARDRAATGRDPDRHFWLMHQVDECAKAIVRALKDINRVIDAHTSKD